MELVTICEVGPRDGLQSQKRMFSVAERVAFIDRLSATGVPTIEATSFVNPKRVPQMADAEDVMERITRRPGTVYAGLALNLRGAERALASGVDEVRFGMASSESLNRRNQGASIAESLAAFGEIVTRVCAANLPCVGIISTAFGCPYEGNVPVARVVDVAAGMAEAGAQRIIIADTIGSGVPSEVRERLRAVREAVGDDIELGCHFHNSRNTGFANAYAAIEEGVRLFDASLGGLGGCPFAPRATGNIATEDLCFMLRNMGFETGIDLPALLDAARWLESFFATPLPGQVMKAGLFPEVADDRVAAGAASTRP